MGLMGRGDPRATELSLPSIGSAADYTDTHPLRRWPWLPPRGFNAETARPTGQHQLAGTLMCRHVVTRTSLTGTYSRAFYGAAD